jgi:hypothetical protein
MTYSIGYYNGDLAVEPNNVVALIGKADSLRLLGE